MTDRRNLLGGLAAGAALALSPRAFAQGAAAFPNRPINIVVAFGPGTGSDTIARILADSLRATMNWQVVVENKLGGGGVIGTEFVARAAPDGYTITMGTASSLGTTPLLNPTAKYRVDRDFAMIAGLAKTDYVFLTNTRPDAPRTLAELVARIRAGNLSYGSAGLGTITHLTTEVLLDRIGAKATHVPYKGSGQVMTDLMAGHIQFACDSPAASLALIRGGKLRALATTGPTRLESLPGTPTVAESGFPGFQVIAWWGVAAPAGTPPDIISKLGEGIVKAISVPEVRDKLKGMEIDLMLMNPREFTDFVNRDTPFWTEFIRKSKITLTP